MISPKWRRNVHYQVMERQTQVAEPPFRLNLTTDHNHHKSTPKGRPENFGWKRIFLRIFLVLLLMYNRADYNTTVTRNSDASCMQGAYNSGKPGNLREGNL